VRDHLHKVAFYESECDRISNRIARLVFSSDLSLERKLHLRFFTTSIDQLADRAEDCGDRLAVYALKRSL